MNTYYGYNDFRNYRSLAHYGVKGMKWGVRKQRELVGRSRAVRTGQSDRYKNTKRFSTAKKVAIGAAIVAGVGLATYGAYKINSKAVMDATYRYVSAYKNNLTAQAIIDRTKGSTRKTMTELGTDRKGLREIRREYGNAAERRFNRALKREVKENAKRRLEKEQNEWLMKNASRYNHRSHI